MEHLVVEGREEMHFFSVCSSLLASDQNVFTSQSNVSLLGTFRYLDVTIDLPCQRS